MDKTEEQQSEPRRTTEAQPDGEPAPSCCRIPSYGHADTCRQRGAYLAEYPLS